jgi:cell division protein FtsQ
VSRRGRSPKVAHGGGIDAPSEFGFVSGESPAPGRVTARPPPGKAPEPPGRGPLSAVWAGLKLCVGFAVVASISVAIAWGAHRYALTTPRFAIREFQVKGNRRFSADQLGRLAGIERGQNLFAVDTDAAAARVLENPWIRQVKVGRELPATVRIEVAEREAVAATILEDGLYLVTPEGVPFKAVEAGDPSDLPIVTGLGARDLMIDRARAVDRIAVALEVLRDYEGLPLSRVYEAEEVHLAPDGTVVLTIGKRGMALYLGTGPFRQKLLMAARILGKLQPGGQLPGILFLDNQAHPERVVARMR